MGKKDRNAAAVPALSFEDFGKISVYTSFSYFKVMSGALQQDTRRCMDVCLELKAKIPEGQPIDQTNYGELNFWYRNLVRAFVTEVEGLLFVMRRIVVWAHDRGEIDLTTAEATLARETEYRIDVRRKKIEEREHNNRLLENFMLVFWLFPRVFRSPFEVNYGVHGWEAFQRVVAARNSITHPKVPEDTLLKADMYNALRDAAVWFYGCISGILGSVDSGYLEQSFKETAKNSELQPFLNRK